MSCDHKTQVEYSLDSYVTLLKTALENSYTFIRFTTEEIKKPGIARCLLRHDVDADLAAASVMAKKEAELGITATYFLMLRSPLYNLFSRSSCRYVAEIIASGHDIALHYDKGFAEDKFPHAEWIQRESELLGCMFDQTITAISFHQPDESILQGEVPCANLINTYDRELLSNFAYFSDSNRTLNFPGDDTCDSFRGLHSQSIQLLIHPMWWVYADEKTDDVWDQAIIQNFQGMQSQLLETEGAFGGERSIKIMRKGNLETSTDLKND